MSPTITPQYNLKANSKTDFTHWRHLVVDVQKDMCDPARSLEKFDSGCFDFNESRGETFRRTKALEDVAHSINDFVTQSRSQLRPVWVCYSVPEYAEPTYENHQFYQNQTEPHVVERQENETLLLKSHASVVPENENFFNQSREDGVQGFVVSGMYASACVHESAVDLIKKGFLDVCNGQQVASGIIRDL